jgi:hypothetical protein
MGIGRLMSMVLAGIRVGGIGWELNRRSHFSPLKNIRILIDEEKPEIRLWKSGFGEIVQF